MACAQSRYGRKGSLKARLAAGEKVYGGFLCSQSPCFAEMMGLAGYDYVVIDLEHGPGDNISALPCVHALEAVGTPAIIRVAWNDKVLLKKALDLGPSGVIVPMVESAKEAAKAVASCRYPPVGVRGAAYPLVRASSFGLDKTYLDTVEKDLLIICQIESELAVDRIKEIADVDGVDCLMIGPRDLSASIGCLADPGHPRLAELMHKAEQAVLASSRKVVLKGIARPVIDPPPALFDRGYQMVSGIVDVLLFTSAAVADIKAYKPQALSLPSSVKAMASSPQANGDHSHIHNSPHGKVSNGVKSGNLCNGSANSTHIPALANGSSNGTSLVSIAESTSLLTIADSDGKSNGAVIHSSNTTAISSNGASNGCSVFTTSNGAFHTANGTGNGISLYVNGASNGINGQYANDGVGHLINGAPAVGAGYGIITVSP